MRRQGDLYRESARASRYHLDEKANRTYAGLFYST
jgi:hypothetical protein